MWRLFNWLDVEIEIDSFMYCMLCCTFSLYILDLEQIEVISLQRASNCRILAHSSYCPLLLQLLWDNRIGDWDIWKQLVYKEFRFVFVHMLLIVWYGICCHCWIQRRLLCHLSCILFERWWKILLLFEGLLYLLLKR